MQSALNSNIRQLLLQAYCAFNVCDDDTIYITFICGVYFSLFRFTRPTYLQPFAEEVVEPGPSPKKCKLDYQHGEFHNVLRKLKRVQDITNPQLSNMLPLECVEVVCHSVPVFEDIRAPQVHLSDGFRQALRDCLAGIDFQPCSLFELQTVQFSQGEGGLVRSLGNVVIACADSLTQRNGVRALTSWYDAARGADQTPPRRTNQKSVYDESSPIVHQRTGEVIPGPSPGTQFTFKGGKINVKPRKMPARQVKTDPNNVTDSSDAERDSGDEAQEEGRNEGETKEGIAK